MKKGGRRKKVRKADVSFWQSIGQIVYDMNCGSVSGLRDVLLAHVGIE